MFKVGVGLIFSINQYSAGKNMREETDRKEFRHCTEKRGFFAVFWTSTDTRVEESAGTG